MTTIACILEDDELGGRHERWLALGARALVDVEQTERGLRLVFTAEPGVKSELLQLAELERECCAFATWDVNSDSERVVLAIAGKSDDAVPAVQEMFRPLRAG